MQTATEQTPLQQELEVSQALRLLETIPPFVHHVRIEEVTAKPIWTLSDLTVVTDVPMSTLNQVIAENPAPFFLLGRRKVIFREDALQWLREVAKRNPWQPRRNNQSTTKN